MCLEQATESLLPQEERQAYQTSDDGSLVDTLKYLNLTWKHTLKYSSSKLNSHLSNHKGKGIEARVTANHHTYEETKCGYGEDDAEETQQTDIDNEKTNSSLGSKEKISKYFLEEEEEEEGK
ncbi:hypothetical protein E2C01_013716 [Portunus trituberculatus]|uniref:Uncharacterized protein n=1 Tax=Portunus trituberculatus TaxID=210409 RepID=A0A5B7DHD5_PORTR|nr:hypothetical protein [Portunus trituberculatus]